MLYRNIYMLDYIKGILKIAHYNSALCLPRKTEK